jgi:predicted nucleotidyltransferase
MVRGIGPILGELREMVAPIARKHGMIWVSLLGSKAGGDNGSDSDYDFTVCTPDGYGLGRIGSFALDLEDALDAKVGIEILNAVCGPPRLREAIDCDRIIFEAGPDDPQR